MRGLFTALRQHLKPYSPRPQIHQWVFRRQVPLNLSFPIASFTFDDFPRTALSNGAPLLKRYGARGTYYASLGLMGGESIHGPLFTRGDLEALIAEGHEIGCHTYSHYGARQTSQSIFEAEILKNRQFMEEILPGYSMKNFAYPGGELTLRLKRRMRKYATTSRGTYEGINRNWADLDLLLCQYLENRIPLDHVKQVVNESVEQPGWLIFYTHEVCDNPSVYGCTPGYMDAVLKIVSDHCRIMTVGEAVSFIQGNQGRPNG